MLWCLTFGLCWAICNSTEVTSETAPVEIELYLVVTCYFVLFLRTLQLLMLLQQMKCTRRRCPRPPLSMSCKGKAKEPSLLQSSRIATSDCQRKCWTRPRLASDYRVNSALHVPHTQCAVWHSNMHKLQHRTTLQVDS